jgi:Metallo-peptidase family M12
MQGTTIRRKRVCAVLQYTFLSIAAIGTFSISVVGLAAPSMLWHERSAQVDNDTRQLNATLSDYRSLSLDLAALRARLNDAPDEYRGSAGLLLDLPKSDGSYQTFSVYRTAVMAPGLAARYPQIRSFAAVALDQPQVHASLDDSPLGFNVMIRATDGVTIIRPTQMGEGDVYISYRRETLSRATEPFRCLLDASHSELDRPFAQSIQAAPSTITGANIRTYRLAMAATGEYTAFFGGTVVNGMAAIVQAVNRVNGIYQTDFAVQFQLVNNNNSLVYTSAATDPYTNDDGFAMLDENQANIDTVIGTANYDIGHVFSTGGGGVADVGVPCTSKKAVGVTGSGSPTGDDFWVDYVAHEMGHQMGALHSFNSTTDNCGGGNRDGGEAFEPGSGSTIMAYAGICGADDLQPHSDPIFHAGSLVPIVANLAGSGATCGAVLTTTNHAPVPNAGGDHSIPMMTPFQLSGSATDQENDTLTYIWEEMDLGAAAPPDTDDGNRPLFRDFVPTRTPTRTVPRLSNVLSNSLSFGETWATTTRDLKFRFTVRDNRPGGGATASDDMVAHVIASAGPFSITSPNTVVSWQGNTTNAVTWNVANTDAAPINCTNVDISLSNDGGQTFPFVLAPNVPNTGSANVVTPNFAIAAARIKVSCVGNIFFDISDQNFSILGDRIFANGFE